MSDKSTWKKVKLGDIAQEISARVDTPAKSGFDKFVGLEHFVSGDMKISRYGSTESLISSMKEFHSGDVLLARRNVYLKRASQAAFDGLCSGDAIVLRERNGKIASNLLPFILNTNEFWSFANANADGSMSKRINVKTLLNYEFHLPPIEEQKRIAEVLWAADEVLQVYINCLTNANEIKRLLLEELSAILSEEKNTVELGCHIEYKSGQVDPKQESYKSLPLVAPNHIESNTGKIICLETAGEQNAISGKYLFESGDIVYSKIRPALNKVFVATFSGLCSADMYPLKVKGKLLQPLILYYLILSKKFIDYATVCSVRTSIPKLNRNDMSKFEFSCPSVKEQNFFLKKMRYCENAISIAKQQITNSKELLFVLIANYLGGAN